MKWGADWSKAARVCYGSAMRPLKEVIVALRHELEAALHGAPSASGVGRLEAGRVVVCLELEVAESAPGEPGAAVAFGVRMAGSPATASAGDARAHTVTIEFNLTKTAPGGPPPPAPAAEVGAETDSTDMASSTDPRVTQLAQVFGAPGGFYSHMRAEVFNSAIDELTDEGIAQLLAVWAGQPVPADDPTVTQVHGQLANLLRSSPAGSAEEGAALLREALAGIGRPELRRLIAATWRNEGLSSALP
jgi:hypothetical protein